MSRSRKVQIMHEYHKGLRPDPPGQALGKNGPFNCSAAGFRYGNNRHMWAKLKVTMRKIERRKNNRATACQHLILEV